MRPTYAGNGTLGGLDTLKVQPHAEANQRTAGQRHCWVQRPPGCVGPWPGVVVEWRRADDSWLALVTYVVTEQSGSTTIQAWLAARLLAPVT